MKKSLVALAALAAAGAASAQSSVTLFGIVDAAVSYYENKTTNGVKLSQTALTNSGYNSSRIGFRGTEDLGGGLAASFWLEAGLGNDNGTAGSTAQFSNQLFNRRSTVSLSGRFGEVRLGRDYVPTFWNDTIFDPFGTNGVGTNAISNAGGGTVLGQLLGISNNSSAGNYVRANNTVGYFLPANLGGFYGQVMYALPERVNYDPAVNTPATPTVASQVDLGYAGGRFGYANGPLDVAVAYGESTALRNFQGGGRATTKNGNVGASWDFGFLKLMGEYSQVKIEQDLTTALAGSLKSNGYLIGGTIPVGPGLIRLSYSYTDFDLDTTATKQKAQKFALGYVHNLSKRTALYATAAYLKNDDIANPGLSVVNGGPVPTLAQSATWGGVEKSMGYDFGIRHSF